MFLDVLDPPWRAAGKHRQLAAGCHPFDQLGDFLHDGQIGRKPRIKHGIETDALERPREAEQHGFHRAGLGVFHQRGRDGRCDLRHHEGVGIGERRHDLVDLALFHQGRRRTDPRALSAENTIRHIHAVVETGRNPRLETTFGEVNGAYALNLVADRYATTAQNALVGIAYQGRRG